MAVLIDGETISALVAADGQPREAADDSGARHMLWREDGAVRSCLLAEWAAEQQAIAARDAERAAVAQLRQQIRTRLVALAGKKVDDLLIGELKTLLLYLVWREGGIDREMKIRPIGEWGK